MSVYESLKAGRASLAVVGLGYVGLPVAVEFGRLVPTIGFDVNKRRIADLRRNKDSNGETPSDRIRGAAKLRFTHRPADLARAKFFIVAVPTPVTDTKQPDLSFVRAASGIIGRRLTKGSIVVFEPTVYPGVTEEVCVPVLERESGLKLRRDFMVGYSPERVNPGDPNHSVATIVKIVSGCCAHSLEEIANVYGLVVRAGIHRAESIRVAEAAKVVENTQRDLNIALMNELALIFHRAGIDTRAVIEAAGTKWNFHKYTPGLVGGHCIGVDPFYLTHLAEKLGHHPEVILSGRRINDSMGTYVANETAKLLVRAGHKVRGARVAVLGVTFKENVKDVRNSRVFDLICELQALGMKLTVCDPHADAAETKREYGVKLSKYRPSEPFDAVVLAVAHSEYRKRLTIEALKKHFAGAPRKGIVIDVKGLFDPAAIKRQGWSLWRL